MIGADRGLADLDSKSAYYSIAPTVFVSPIEENRVLVAKLFCVYVLSASQINY